LERRAGLHREVKDGSRAVLRAKARDPVDPMKSEVRRNVYKKGEKKVTYKI
jgi:hypothetical protein